MIWKVMLGIAGLVLLLVCIGIYKQSTAQPPRPATGELKHAERGTVRLSYHVKEAGGPTIILIPSAGRAASDFNELALALHNAGYKTIAVEPRGMLDDSGVDEPNFTLFDMADDIAAIAGAEQSESHLVIGHAFGNRVARAYATRYPAATRGVVLLAAGGKVKGSERAHDALIHSFWFFMPDVWRRKEVRLAFFAADNPVPDHWMGGWNVPVSLMQGKATESVQPSEWWAGGAAPILVVQGMQDSIAPPENAELLRNEFSDRVEVIAIDQAGHALLHEQPEQVGAAVIDFAARIFRNRSKGQ